MKILIIEDDFDLCQNLVACLEREGYACRAVHTATDGRRELHETHYDLLILDWRLPDGSGLDVLKEHRLAGGTTRTLILTGKTDIENTLEGLESGADDYLKKPFDMRELAIRLKVLARRPESQYSAGMLTVGKISIDRAQRKAFLAGEEVALAPREFTLLEFLLSHSGKILPTKLILKHVWLDDASANTDALSTSVTRLRAKLDSKDNVVSVVRNVHGVGYGIFPNL
ncbi:MAG: response regulator transcription factor [Cyanobacteria bacterium SZAS TMP-1]|nr:response regulator transcription factor [Cyanobacteria bacterium SZAS TMP-1]